MASDRPQGIDPIDHDLLSFAISWLPYGSGPDDEILVNFGLTPQRYLERLRDVVEREHHRIHPSTLARLMAVVDKPNSVIPPPRPCAGSTSESL